MPLARLVQACCRGLGSSSNSVDQADTPALNLLDPTQFKSTASLRRRKESLPFTGDERVNNEPELIHQPGVNEARRRASTSDEIDVLFPAAA